jgi:spore germination protein KC
MKRAALLTALLVTLVLPLSGCWDGVELQKRAIVLLIGIDPADRDSVKVSMQLALPYKLGRIAKGEAGTDKQTATISQEGASVAEALHKIQSAVDRRLFFGHLQAVVINQRLAQQGVMPVLNPLVQARIVPRNAWLFISSIAAEQLTKIDPEADPIPSSYLANFFTNEILLDRPYEGTVGGFHQRLVTPGVEPFAFWISGEGTSSVPRIEGIAVFQRDRLVGTLPHDLFVGWSFVENQFSKTYINFPCPAGDGQFPVNVTSVRSDVRLQPATTGRPAVQIRIHLVGDVEGGVCARVESQARLQALEHAAAQQVQTLALQSIRTCEQRWGADIFGLGLTLYRQYPRQWPGDQRWRNLFRKLKVDVRASARLDFAQTYQASAAKSQT